jgi:hypothetical protein
MNTVDELAVVSFSIVVRTVGLLACLASGACLFFGLITLVLGGPANGAGIVIVFGPVFVAGLWLLRGAPAVIAFAFPGVADESVAMATEPTSLGAWRNVDANN